MGDSAASWRHRAETFVQQGRYAEAADAYRREAAIYRRNGDINAAQIEESKANRWTSGIRLFAEIPGMRPPAPKRPLAKFEPRYGCYIGAFLDRDERLGSPFTDENFQQHCDPSAFGRGTGKKHASVFCYLSYGNRFPSRWVEWLKRHQVVPHIAWEPNNGLEPVQDNNYLREFAMAAARADCPIFLRFASEMNGDWTRYGGNPLRYKQKWGLVTDVMRRYAPNVAMVWCVNSIPEKPIDSYYPGDGYVDWVGINFYSVPFHDNSRSRPGLNENPADQLRYVYNLYAAHKPIMICEFGASRMAALDRVDRSPWAARKIAELYAALPRLYPHVKLIDIFDNDNLRHAEPGRQLSNYSVTDNETVTRAYARSIAPDYFLSTIGDNCDSVIVPLGERGAIVKPGEFRLSAWARCYAEKFTVEYAVNGKTIHADSEPGARPVILKLGTGRYQIAATIRDDKGRSAVQKQVLLEAR